MRKLNELEDENGSPVAYAVGIWDDKCHKPLRYVGPWVDRGTARAQATRLHNKYGHYTSVIRLSMDKEEVWPKTKSNELE